MENSLSNNEEKYFMKQIFTSCLSQFSYYIESNKEALVIDPIRDCDGYIELLEKNKAKIKYIFLTHFHADFVSGHIELAAKYSAQIVLGPNAKAQYEFHLSSDGEIFPLGEVQIKLIHTPGHTIESSSFVLLVDNITKAIFTGDCLFLGEVGRPDLAVNSEINEKDLAGMLYDSLQKLLAYPDEILIYPGHGAGSACGKKILAGGSDTLGNQKKSNYALNCELTKEEFIEIVTSNISRPPPYFFYDAMINKKGYNLLDEIIEKSLKPIEPDEYYKQFYLECITLDTRDFNESLKLFLKNSYLISLKITYAIWTATLFSPDTKFVIITDPGKEKESIKRLARVGYENIIGYVNGGIVSLQDYLNKNNLSSLLVSCEIPDIEEYLGRTVSTEIIDVREEFECKETGVLKEAKILPLSSLEKRLQSGIEIEKDNPVGVYCKTGGRASIAASILKKYGYEKVIFLGGVMQMQAKSITLNK